MSRSWKTILLTCLLGACAAEPPRGASGSEPGGKGDIPKDRFEFQVQGASATGPGRSAAWSYLSCSGAELGVTASSLRSGESIPQLSLVASNEDGKERQSWRGREPYVHLASSEGCTSYRVELLNWSEEPVRGTVQVVIEQPQPGLTLVSNDPDCASCPDPAGGLRTTTLKLIQRATRTLDVAIYGFSDPLVRDALCKASRGDVTIRVMTDDDSEDPEHPESYWPHLFGPDGLAGCGIQIDAVRGSGYMHHKFVIADGGTPRETLLIGSANFTPDAFDLQHNHALLIRGAPALVQAYQAEFDQLTRHCRVGRLTESSRCEECTPACTEDRGEEGPWTLPTGATVELHFAPSDSPLRILRGEARAERREHLDPSCDGPESRCTCRPSGTSWMCDYCAEGDDGWGLLGSAQRRIMASLFSATDRCFALGLVRAKDRAPDLDVVTIWDWVQATNASSGDEQVCAGGITTYQPYWGGGSIFALNHNKIVVVDDVVFDGSMNLSENAAKQNHENALVIRDVAVAADYAAYIDSEVTRIVELGDAPREAASCLCADRFDNDRDGVADADDEDCDSGS